MAIEILPFTDDHLEEAARMVAARYQTEREREPSSPAEFEDPAVIRPLLRDLTESASAVAAVRDGRLAGFLSAFLISIRGIQTAFSPDFGHAADPAGGGDMYRRMYASLAHRWLAQGYFNHAITVFTHEREARVAWFSLGFGLTVIDAVRDLSPAEGTTAGVEIRRAAPEDVDLLAPLEVALRRHLAAAPIFIPLIVDEEEKSRERWLSEPDHALWLAFQDGNAVAFMCVEPSRSEVLPITDKATMAITGAYTEESVRGRGIGTALLNQALDWARSAGYGRCAVDFESANIPGTLFWLGKGFQPVCYSLTRRVDDRIAWADEDRDDAHLARAFQGQAEVD